MKSIGSGYAIFILSNLVAIFLTPFILKHISIKEYGFYIICLDLFIWMGFLQIGTAKVLGPMVSMNIESSEKSHINELINNSFWIQFLSGIIAILLYILVSKGTFTPESTVEKSNSFIFIFSLSAAMQMVTQLFLELVASAKKLHQANKIRIAILFLQTGLSVLLIPMYGLYALVMLNFFNALSSLIYLYFLTKRNYNYLSLNIKHLNVAVIKSLVKNGFYFSIASLAGVLITRFDNIIISKYFSIELVTKLTISIKLLILAEKSIEIAFNNLRPYISSFYNNTTSVANIHSIYEEINLLITACSTLIYAIIIAINEGFVHLWVGREYYIGHKLFLLFASFYLVSTCTLPSRLILVSTLKNVKEMAYGRVLHGVLRAIFILLIIGHIKIEYLPLSNVALLFTTTFLVQMYFISRNSEVNFIKLLKNNSLTLIAPIATLALAFSDFEVLTPAILTIISIGALIKFLKIKDKEIMSFIKY